MSRDRASTVLLREQLIVLLKRDTVLLLVLVTPLLRL